MWTQLIEAMRADGLIAHCITQSGPATNAVIMDAVTNVANGPWLSMNIKPEPKRDVVGLSKSGRLHILQFTGAVWSYNDGWCCNPDNFYGYTHINTSGAPK
jgi:hypothetical protein